LNLVGTPENGYLKFKCLGKTLHCSEEALPVLEKLNDAQYHAVRELIDLAPGRDGIVISFLQAMVLQGILITAPEIDRRSTHRN